MQYSRVLAGVAAVALAGGGWLAATTPAFAHDTLTGSNPENNSVISAMPATLTLEFNEAMLDIGTTIKLTDHDGSAVTTTTPTTSGATVSTEVPDAATAAEGAYSLAWRVVSQDGHPIEGTIEFTVSNEKAPSTGSSTPSVSATASAETGATDEHESADEHDSESEHDSAEQVSSSNEAVDSTDTASTGTAVLWTGGAIVVVIAALVVVILTRRRKTGSGSDTDE